MTKLFPLVALLLTASTASAALPAPATEWTDFPMSFASSAPGPFAADSLLQKPAGKNGPIVARDGHFYTSADPNAPRIRFLGVNLCFGANFPPHDQSDLLAARLSRFGINIVRFHHMDSRSYPGGIFADKSLTTLSPEALDHLDYLIAVLKKNGIYADLNLHVSRPLFNPADGSQHPARIDKFVDLFDPALIDAEKQYAHDLLTHVNAYTHAAYTDEPAVALIEFNNENTMFRWDGVESLAKLPEPYATEFTHLWNTFLLNKYKTRNALATAWNANIQPIGDNVLKDSTLTTVGKTNSPWRAESHGTAKMSAEKTDDSATLHINAIDDKAWHLQFNQAAIALKKSSQYTVTFTAVADKKRDITVSTGQAHEPFANLGLAATVHLTTTPKTFTYYFSPSDDESNARLSFALGDATGDVTLSRITLTPGGQTGLLPEEDPAQNTVKTKSGDAPNTAPRSHDWYAFLQSTDAAYFDSFRDYLKNDLHAKAPITGSIGLGALGTLTQSTMDFVDAHEYWQHPQFPGKAWDSVNWKVLNTPMVDSPSLGKLADLAAVRVAGKPFTVTEYNHPAPSDWRAEGVPLLATFAALQDWDAVFLFAYSHTPELFKDHASSFFDIEGDPARMSLMPVAARLFLSGAIRSIPARLPVYISPEDSMNHADRYYHTLLNQLETLNDVTPENILHRQLAITFSPNTRMYPMHLIHDDRPLTWTTGATGTGQFTFADPHAAVFVGFPKNMIDLGPLTLKNITTPYVVATLTAQNPTEELTTSHKLLLTLNARTQSTDQQWNPAHTSVSTHFGKAPPQLETLHATLTLPTGYTLTPLDSAGNPMGAPLTKSIDLSKTNTCLFLIDKQ